MNFEQFSVKCCDYINCIYDDVTVSSISVTKNNGFVLSGLQFKRDDNNIAPTIYLEGYFREYEEGRNLYKICDEIIASYEQAKLETMPDLDFFNRYETVRNRMFCRVVNRDRNSKLLESVPYVECMDLAIVFYLIVNVGEQSGSILIRNEHMKMWKTDLGHIYHDAMTNNLNCMKSCVYSIEDVLIEMLKDRKDDDLIGVCQVLDYCKESEGNAPMYVLTNKEKYYGAACILDESFLADFAESLQCEFYILPSSIHELILIPDKDGISVDSLAEMVSEVNVTQVSEEEVLSNTVYKFSRAIGKVVPA